MSTNYVTIKSALTLADGVDPITPRTLATVGRQIADSDAATAMLAYAVRKRGVVGVKDGAASVAALATAVFGTDSKRSMLSQWASAAAYVVDAGAEYNAATFRTARVIYGRGRVVRDKMADAIARVAALPEADRTAAFIALYDAPALANSSGKRGAQPDDGSKSSGSPDSGTDSDAGNAPATLATRSDWIASLDRVSRAANLLAGASDAEIAHVRATLATLAATVDTHETANRNNQASRA